MRILILDDDPARHDWFAVHYHGHELVTCWTAAQAIAALDQVPDLVHLDHDLELSAPGAQRARVQRPAPGETMQTLKELNERKVRLTEELRAVRDAITAHPETTGPEVRDLADIIGDGMASAGVGWELHNLSDIEDIFDGAHPPEKELRAALRYLEATGRVVFSVVDSEHSWSLSETEAARYAAQAAEVQATISAVERDFFDDPILSRRSRLLITIDAVTSATGVQLPDAVAARWTDAQRREAYRWANDVVAASKGAGAPLLVQPRCVAEWLAAEKTNGG